MPKYAVFSYDPDQQQWFCDAIAANNAEAAAERVCQLRPYVIDADGWSIPNLEKLLTGIKGNTEEDCKENERVIADESCVDICRTCNAVYDPYGDGYDGECPDCADKREVKNG
jgi:hypothetical protein